MILITIYYIQTATIIGTLFMENGKIYTGNFFKVDLFSNLDYLVKKDLTKLKGYAKWYRCFEG